MGYIGAIIAGVGQTINLIGRATSSPNYPSPPKLHKIDIPAAQAQMEGYEQNRMEASIDAWKQRFPELYKGGQSMIDSIGQQQQGLLGSNITSSMASSGLEPVHQGDQYALSRDIGLSPITLSQRTSQAVTRQIAQNPEWSNKITGGTLATMLANNYQNQQAYGMFKSANQTAQYVAGQQAGMYNTQALLGGLTGAARIGAQVYGQNQYGALSPQGQGIYQYQASSQPQYTPAPAQYPQQQQPGAPYGPFQNAYTYGFSPFQQPPGQQTGWPINNDTANSYVMSNPYGNYDPYGDG